MNPAKTVCLDWDDTLCDLDGTLVEGAKEAIQELTDAGFAVYVWTSITVPERLTEVQRMVAMHELSVAGILSDKKPPAIAYVDDHAVAFDGSWPSVVNKIVGKGNKSMAKLHLLIGLPGSGKSTFCQKAIPDAVQISHDRLVAQFKDQDIATAAELAACRSALGAGKDVILDRLNLTVSNRKRWMKLARDCGAQTVGYFWDLGLERQWIGNLARPIHKHVQANKIQHMATKLERPTLVEGFHELFNVVQDEFGFRELRASLE